MIQNSFSTLTSAAFSCCTQSGPADSQRSCSFASGSSGRVAQHHVTLQRMRCLPWRTKPQKITIFDSREHAP